MNAPCAGMQGKMLPSVTAEDNGDVLTVVDGEWSKASGGGGGGAGAFMVKFILDMQTGEITSADKTAEEIYQACKDGKNVVGLVNYIMEDTGNGYSESFTYLNLDSVNYSYEINGSEKTEVYEMLFEQDKFSNYDSTAFTCDLSVIVIQYISENGVSTIEMVSAKNKSAS